MQVPDGQTIGTLRETFGEAAGNVKFVELVPETTLGYVRFADAESASKALKMDGMGEMSLLEGEDEKQYWDKIGAGSGGRGGGKGRGRGRGGKGGRGKGKGGRGKGRGKGRRS